MIAGIAGGLGDYLGIDPVLVRLGIVALILAGGAGILAYIVAWFIIPEEPYSGAAAEAAPERASHDRPAAITGPRIVIGAILIVVGAALLLDWTIPAVGPMIWPVALVVAGAGLLLHGARRCPTPSPRPPPTRSLPLPMRAPAG